MTRRFAYLLTAITGAAALVRVWGIGQQALTLDELLMLPTANHFVRFGVPRPELPFHPNLRNILLYSSGRVFGASAAGLKGWSILFGVLSVSLLGLLVWRLTRSETASLVAATLLAFDPLSVYMSRSALQDCWTVFFTLAGLHLALSIIDAKPGTASSGATEFATWGAPLCGAMFGLGVASKFYVVPIEAVTIVYVAVVLWRHGRRPLAVWVSGAVAITSIFVFTLTYVPWFRAGNSAVEWFTYQRALLQAIGLHAIHIPLDADIHAWQWFLRPFVAWQEMEYASPLPKVSSGIANPFTWLVVLPSAAIVLRSVRKQRGAATLLGLFLISYVFMLSPNRPIWVLSAVSVEPFAFAIVGLAVDRIGQYKGGAKTAIAYVLVATAVSVALLPGAIGNALETEYLRKVVRRASYPGELLPPIQQQLDR